VDFLVLNGSFFANFLSPNLAISDPKIKQNIFRIVVDNVKRI